VRETRRGRDPGEAGILARPGSWRGRDPGARRSGRRAKAGRARVGGTGRADGSGGGVGPIQVLAPPAARGSESGYSGYLGRRCYETWLSRGHCRGFPARATMIAKSL